MDKSVTANTMYYYFIEATRGTETVVTPGFPLTSTYDNWKYSANKSYQNQQFASLIFNPATGSFERA